MRARIADLPSAAPTPKSRVAPESGFGADFFLSI
jgi:hypothetical protein